MLVQADCTSCGIEVHCLAILLCRRSSFPYFVPNVQKLASCYNWPDLNGCATLLTLSRQVCIQVSRRNSYSRRNQSWRESHVPIVSDVNKPRRFSVYQGERDHRAFPLFSNRTRIRTPGVMEPCLNCRACGLAYACFCQWLE